MVTSHAFGRAKQRHRLAQSEVLELARKIRAGDAVFAEARGGVEFWIVSLHGRDVPVVWRPDSEIIVTVLPRHALTTLRRAAKFFDHD